jgi:uncharacterized protein DUF5335
MSNDPILPVETKQIPRDQWKAYFDHFTRQYLKEAESETATVEVLSPTLGDRFETERVRLLGLSYSPQTNLFELELESVEDVTFEPAEIWVMEEDDGFICNLDMVRSDGTNEVIYLRKSGPLAPGDEIPLSPP